MSDDGLERVGKEIEAQLEEIRVRVRAPLGDPPTMRSIDVLGGWIEDNIKPGDPIIIKGKFHLVYIKDHSYQGFKRYHDSKVASHPNKCFVAGNRVHFYSCPTFRHMSDIGRRSRYCAARQVSSTQPIDLKDAENIKTRLLFCWHCIAILDAKVDGWGAILRRGHVARYADARKLMDCVISCYRGESPTIHRTVDLCPPHS